MRKNMKAERARVGLTTKEVAQLVGVSINQISRWELGLQEPSATHLLDLARLYKCSPEYLMEITDELNEQIVASPSLCLQNNSSKRKA